MTRSGRIDLFWDVSGVHEMLFSLLLLVGLALVIAPFIGLLEIGRWVYGQFSPAARRAHAEARRQKQPRNPRLDRDRIARRLAASKQRAARRTAVQTTETDTAPANDPSGESVSNE